MIKNCDKLFNGLISLQKNIKNEKLNKKCNYLLIRYNLLVLKISMIENCRKKPNFLKSKIEDLIIKKKKKNLINEFFEEYFNKENNYEYKELERSERVINFFCKDFFYYEFKLRDLDNILSE